MNKADGGPAFPSDEIDQRSGELHRQYPGMSLRDAFAMSAPISVADAAAVAGFVSGLQVLGNDRNRYLVFLTLARLRYEYADAMLRAESEA